MTLKIVKEPRTWSQARQRLSGAVAGWDWFWMTATVVSCLAAGDEDGSWLSFFLVADCIVKDIMNDG